MNADEFAQRLYQRLTDPSSNSLEPMSHEEVCKLTAGDIAALKQVEPAAWLEMVLDHVESFERSVAALRQENAEFQARLARAREYPHVAESLQWHIGLNNGYIELWEALVSGDAARLRMAKESSPDSWRRLRAASCQQSERRTALYYNNRIASPIFWWMCITNGGRHAPTP